MRMTAIKAIGAADVQHLDIAGCTCPACTGGVARDLGNPNLDRVTLSVEDASVDRLAGNQATNGKAIWTADQAADYLNRTGANWITGANPGVQSDTNLQEITFGFHRTVDDLENNGYVYTTNGTDYFGLSEYFQFGAFSDAQKAAARIAMGFWDDVAAISFRETNIDDADITFGNLTNSPNTQAYSRLPSGTVTSNPAINAQIRDIVGDVWISAAQTSNFTFGTNGYGLNTLTHEIGHSLGLSHPGNYNFSANFTANYANGAEYYQDLRNYSIMSYWNPGDAADGTNRAYDFNIMTTGYGVTPMVHDILAIQKMYGADMTTRTGDTTYGFNSNAGKDVFDFTLNKAPIMTIWDAGGTDTLDASGYRVDQEINLTAGSLSSIGGVTYAETQDGTLTFEKVNANRAAMGYPPVTRATYDANVAALGGNATLGRMLNNVGIAYGATVENAIGGSGNDTMIGNAANNVLTGGAGNDRIGGNDGNDVLIGGVGADVLDGGVGTDTASYRDAAAGVIASLLTGTGTAGEAAGDTFVSIERLEGGAFGDVLTGGNNADQLFGLAGADRLDGGAGADLLDGGFGDDNLLGGVGADALFGGEGADRLDGGNDNDSLDGGAGADTLLGGSGVDVLLGGAGDDSLDGGSDADRLEGGDGADVLLGGIGRDTLLGGAGDDRLDGGSDDDSLDGGDGADRLDGGNGRDTLLGGAGDDVLLGGNDDDRINGGLGADTLTGGFGKDVFAFADRGSTDTVLDFRRGEDKLDFSGLGMSNFIGSDNFHGTAGELRTYTVGRNVFLTGDMDGDGSGDFTVALGTSTFAFNDLILNQFVAS